MVEQRFRDAQRLSHAYMISALDPEESLRTARQLAAAAVCTGQDSVPCGQCRACRKVRENIHPDVITIGRPEDDKGRKKREIGVEQIRQLSRDAVVLPNEAERKVYIIEDADKMNLPAQNAALKLLEEPPRGVMFLLCVENAQLLLPTVRSRCAEILCSGGPAEEDAESLKLARDYVKTVSGGSRAAVYRWCAEHESMDNRAAAAFVQAASALLADMLCGREAAPELSRSQLRRLLALMERCGSYLQVNVGVRHIFGLLAVKAIDSGGNRG
ncbi:MAG: hypothetical protein IK116_03070 [Firmicutes bacterium]|nr:hypothetical protein [Bacillota bacterium]